MAGAVNIQKQSQVVIGGIAYGVGKSIVASSSVEVQQVLPAAQVGQLTTRTSNTAGTLTMTTVSAGGITTAALFDMYWAGGTACRRGVIAGTVSGQSVPFTGGSGDNLPTNMTNVTTALPQTFTFAPTGNTLQALACNGGVGAFTMFSFQASGPTESLAVANLPTGVSYDWFNGNGVVNPLTGVSVLTLVVSNGDSAQSTTIKASAAFN